MCPGDYDETAIRLAAILDATEGAIVTTDLDSTILSWNAAAEELFGFKSTEVIGCSIRVLYPKGRTDEEYLIGRARNGESLRDIDAVHLTRNGTNVHIALTVVPLRAPTGEIVGTLRISRDVGGRQVGDRAARRLAAIVESSDDAIISKDLNGIVTSWNRAAERMFGYTQAEIIGHSIRLLIPSERQAEEDTVLASIRRGEAVDHFETIRRHKDGGVIPISLTVSPIRDAAGRVVGASKIARDIGERKRAEAERIRLLSASEQNAAITDRLNQVGAVVASGLDRTKIVQAVTDAGTELTTAEFGAFFYNVIDEQGDAYALHAISGVPKEKFADFPMPRNTALLEPTFRGTGVVRSDDVTQDARYGHNAPYYGMPRGHLPVRSYLAVPIKSRSGEVLGGLLFGHSAVGRFDERHERLALGIASWAAVALENARLYAQVQQASRLKDDFLATLSHELRTPLNAILGYARMIRGGLVPPDKQAKAIATIERNATSLTQIVEDVLDVSRIISGKLRLNVRPVQLAEVVKSAMESVIPAADAKGIDLSSVLDPSAGPVLGDTERLQQIVWNLLSNAVKFTDRGGRVQVAVERADSHIHLVVSDTGIGIPAEFLPHMFDRFRQADASTTRERGGLGLGLAIVRQLVEMHGGSIEAASDGVGCGATFRMQLPLMAVRAGVEHRRREMGRAVALGSMHDLTGVRVLVVDDDRDALDMVRDILEAAGADVAVADSAMTAIETIAALRPDVLVSDLGMPRMDGFELIAQVRRSGDLAVRNVPAAALTAYARSDERDRALQCGFQLHLSKPIDPAELVAAVASLKPSAAIEPIATTAPNTPQLE